LQYKTQFKAIFDEAQRQLKSVFGMTLVELPHNRENISLNQQRKAAAATVAAPSTKNAKAKNTSATTTSNKSWILVSTLPEAYRAVTAPALPDDQSLAGISTTIITLVYLNNSNLAEKTLDRYLRRLGAEDGIALETGSKEVGSIERIMSNLVKWGYLVKMKDDVPPGTEMTFTYKIGPRAKVEIGKEGVLEHVKAVSLLFYYLLSFVFHSLIPVPS